MSVEKIREEARRRALALLEKNGITSVNKVFRGFDEQAVEAARRLGLDSSLDRAAYVQVNEEIVRSMLERRLARQGVVVKPLARALSEYPWLAKYYWSSLPVDHDVYTALVAVYGDDKGYVVYVPPGTVVETPIYVCLLVTVSGETQLLHNIVVLGDGAKATLITGCGASHGVGKVAHIGATEIYLGKGAELNYVMIHSWSPGSEVRPRTSISLGEGARYTEYYVSYGGVGVLDSELYARINGEAKMYSANIIVAEKSSKYSMKTLAKIIGEGGSAELVSRIIGHSGSHVRTEAVIEAEAPHAKGHIECLTLPLGRDAVVETVPVLRSRVESAELSHEAAIGKLNEDELAYLMARGLDEEQARAILLRGFLHVEVPGLPSSVKRLIASVEKTLAEKGAY
ncbi:SufD family Fe-S cluster assembly protein [Pyrofollis japonicus]|uniref:SufD family Fe-S cluster assembly protein n=1 Tax=Pyrofollis japonicus TaxID=3060460 RepID=UPI00295AC780|nr:SufD family Fe-S cluster assembly protein [Pyrofollis japonicus]BEP16869.1 SufD family Fe-S cluster assembly protein [Pyrofollis japonicus]